MKINAMTNSEVKKGAKIEAKAINTNPTYLMRKLNKFATGKESDLSDLKKGQGLSVDYIKDQYKRLEEAFGCGGFWWGSVMARNGYLLTSCKEVKLEDGESDMTPIYSRDGFVWTEVVDGTLYTFKAAASWSLENIITSSSMMLRFAEARAKQAGQLYSWQQARKDAKSKASKKSKTSKKSEKSALERAAAQLSKAFEKGEINAIELANGLAALKVA